MDWGCGSVVEYVVGMHGAQVWLLRTHTKTPLESFDLYYSFHSLNWQLCWYPVQVSLVSSRAHWRSSWGILECSQRYSKPKSPAGLLRIWYGIYHVPSLPIEPRSSDTWASRTRDAWFFSPSEQAFELSSLMYKLILLLSLSSLFCNQIPSQFLFSLFM